MRSYKLVLAEVDAAIQTFDDDNSGRIEMPEYVHMFCQGEFKMSRGMSGETRALVEELVRNWTRPTAVTVRLEMDSSVVGADIEDITGVLVDGLGAKVESIEIADDKMLVAAVVAEDALSLQWKLMTAVGPFLLPGRSIVSCTVVAKYRVLLRGNMEQFDFGTSVFQDEISQKTGNRCQVIRSTALSQTWNEVYVEAQISEPRNLHKWIVNLEGACFCGFEVVSAALVTPLESAHCVEAT